MVNGLLVLEGGLMERHEWSREFLVNCGLTMGKNHWIFGWGDDLDGMGVELLDGDRVVGVLSWWPQ